MKYDSRRQAFLVGTVLVLFTSPRHLVVTAKLPNDSPTSTDSAMMDDGDDTDHHDNFSEHACDDKKNETMARIAFAAIITVFMLSSLVVLYSCICGTATAAEQGDGECSESGDTVASVQDETDDNDSILGNNDHNENMPPSDNSGSV